jgi:ribonuclease HII
MKNNMYFFEKKYWKLNKLVAGVDEAGRGAWAGPIVVASCILPVNYKNDDINDSKLLSKLKRNKLFEIIKKQAIAYSIIFIDSVKVDELNPKGATIMGIKNAIESLSIQPSAVLIDAEKIQINVETVSIIKGDQKSINIAAASILAKVSRDKYMENIDSKYPQYGFSKHKGYGTSEHHKNLIKFLPIKSFHRFSYKPIKDILDLKNKL